MNIVNAKGLKRRRREPGEVTNRGQAIQNMCRECQGFETNPGDGTMAHVIRECSATACWLWPWRNGTADPAALER